MKAVWKDVVIAESDETIVIEGNQYFPLSSVTPGVLAPSDHTTDCIWKGTAHYYHITVAGEVNQNAAWYYPSPKEGSAERVGRDFANYVAFWKGVTVG